MFKCHESSKLFCFSLKALGGHGRSVGLFFEPPVIVFFSGCTINYNRDQICKRTSSNMLVESLLRNENNETDQISSNAYTKPKFSVSIVMYIYNCGKKYIYNWCCTNNSSSVYCEEVLIEEASCIFRSLILVCTCGFLGEPRPTWSTC